MSYTRRTQKEIENDCKKLKNAAKNATNMGELAKLTGMSYQMVNTTLSKHPIILKRIKEQLAVNKEKSKTLTQVDVLSKNTALSIFELPFKTDDTISGFVLDASITGLPDLKKILEQLCAVQTKIILTSITIRELGKMQEFKDLQAKDARYILGLALDKPDCFELVRIDETLGKPDDCIVKYCADHKDAVTLLTSDKEMALNAKMYDVQVHYFKKFYIPSKEPTNSKIATLFLATKQGDKLVLPKFHTTSTSIRLISQGLEYNDGIRELHIGDDVFIASQKIGFLTFAHYRMVSLNTESNCELVYSKRIASYKAINRLTPRYRAFMRDFMTRRDIKFY